MFRDGHRCTDKITLPDGSERRCEEAASDVDHINPGDDHTIENLRALCGWHHSQKSAREGRQALDRKREQISQRFRRGDGR